MIFTPKVDMVPLNMSIQIPRLQYWATADKTLSREIAPFCIGLLLLFF